jgi:hypothetical protein
MGDLSDWFFPVVGILVVVVVMVAALARVTGGLAEFVVVATASGIVLVAVGAAVRALLEY